MEINTTWKDAGPVLVLDDLFSIPGIIFNFILLSKSGKQFPNPSER